VARPIEAGLFFDACVGPELIRELCADANTSAEIADKVRSYNQHHAPADNLRLTPL